MRTIATLKVAPLCLGGNVFGWTADRDSAERILDAFVDGGGNFVDTADVYSAWVPGHTGESPSGSSAAGCSDAAAPSVR